MKSTARIPSDLHPACVSLNNCLLSLLKEQWWNIGFKCDSWKRALSFLPRPLLLSVSHMFECCFPLLCKSGVHGSDRNVAFEVFLRSTHLMQTQKCLDIQSLSNFLFLHPLFSRPVSIFLLQSVSVVAFAFGWNCFVKKFICGVESASSPSSSKSPTPSMPTHSTVLHLHHPVLKKCLLSLCYRSVLPIYSTPPP